MTAQVETKARATHIRPLLLQPRTIVVGLSVFDVVWMWIRDSRVAWQFIDYHGYYADTREAFVLLIASLVLLLHRRWTCAIAALVSATTIYVHVFLALRGIASAHDISIASPDAWRHWLLDFKYQPQYAFHLTIAVLIFVVSALPIARSERR